jgi:twitching motility protein PilT
MQVDQLIHLLSRGDVKEIALQSGKPPCALVSGAYKPITNQNVSEEQIMLMLGEASGKAAMLGLLEGPQRWKHVHRTAGEVQLAAKFHGSTLQVRITRMEGAQPIGPKKSLGEPKVAPPRQTFPDDDRTGGARASAKAAPPPVPARTRTAADFDLPPMSPPRGAGLDVDFSAPAPEPELLGGYELDMQAAGAAKAGVPGFGGESGGLGDDFDALPPLGAAPGEAPRAPASPAARAAAPAFPRSSFADDLEPRAFAEPSAAQPEPAFPRSTLDRDKPSARSRRDPRDSLLDPEPPSFDQIPSDEAKPFPAPARAPSGAMPRAVAAAPRREIAEVAEPEMEEPHWPIGGEDDRLKRLLLLAVQRRASDLHVVAERPPMLRIAGALEPQGEALPSELVKRMLMPRVPRRMLSELREHGSVDFSLVIEGVGRFRANVSRQRTGMKLTARPIPTEIPTLAQLGLPESIASATHHHQGLIVVTGPTGHGKTTTLAAIVDIINSGAAHHIITVEDPIEYVHPRKQSVMSQREVGTHTKKFASALKGSLREDPDVIVVGELRDTETVRMALSASETGHLVISTMNTPSAAKAIERIIDLFPPSDQPQVRMTLAGGLRLVISQRLLPTTDGKSLCAAAELLPGTSALWALIRDNKTFQIPSLQQRGKALGIIRLDESLAALVREGKTTLEHAMAVAEAPADLSALVSGRSTRAGDESISLESLDPTAAAAQRAKDVFSRAGKLFGGDKK